MRTREPAGWPLPGHTSNDNAYLALGDLIIEYKAALVIIHDRVVRYPGADRIITS